MGRRLSFFNWRRMLEGRVPIGDDLNPLSSPVTQAHVHFREPGVSAGVMFFLCTNLGNGPAGKPAWPANRGTVKGTITAASIIGPSRQEETPGEFAPAPKINPTEP